MYIFLTMEQVVSILLGFGIDITVFTLFEQTVLLILCNIFHVITIFVLGYFVYRFLLKLKRILF